MARIDEPKDHSRDSISFFSDEDEEPRTGLLTRQQPITGTGRNVRSTLICIAIAVLWVLSLAVSVKIASRGCHTDGFAAGFDTDLEPLRSALEVKQVKFTGSLDYDENGTLHRTFEPGEIQYIGEPNPEIDAAWEALVEVDGVDLVGDEAASVAGTTFQKPGGAWLVGVDAFHQLHCINMMYKNLYPDYYPRHHSPDFHRTHLEHCIDYLRQLAMCSLDITPVPVEWTTRWNRRVHHFDTLHTCRDFDRVKGWMLQRSRRNHWAPPEGQPWPGPLPGPGVRDD